MPNYKNTRTKESVETEFAKFHSLLTEVRDARATLKQKEEKFSNAFGPYFEDLMGKTDVALIEVLKAGFELGQTVK